MTVKPFITIRFIKLLCVFQFKLRQPQQQQHHLYRSNPLPSHKKASYQGQGENPGNVHHSHGMNEAPKRYSNLRSTTAANSQNTYSQKPLPQTHNYAQQQQPFVYQNTNIRTQQQSYYDQGQGHQMPMAPAPGQYYYVPANGMEFTPTAQPAYSQQIYYNQGPPPQPNHNQIMMHGSQARHSKAIPIVNPQPPQGHTINY